MAPRFKRSIKGRFMNLSLDQVLLLEQLQKRFPKLNFVEFDVYYTLNYRYGVSVLTICGSFKVGKTSSISILIYEDLVIKVSLDRDGSTCSIKQWVCKDKELLIVELETFLKNMLSAVERMI